MKNLSKEYRELLKMNIFDESWYRQKYNKFLKNKEDVLEDYILSGWKNMRNPNRYFNTEFYLDQLKESLCDENPLFHYINTGWKTGLNPSQCFDGAWYLKRYPDVLASGVNPLVHYLLHGQQEGRLTTPKRVLFVEGCDGLHKTFSRTGHISRLLEKYGLVTIKTEEDKIRSNRLLFSCDVLVFVGCTITADVRDAIAVARINGAIVVYDSCLFENLTEIQKNDYYIYPTKEEFRKAANSLSQNNFLVENFLNINTEPEDKNHDHLSVDKTVYLCYLSRTNENSYITILDTLNDVLERYDNVQFNIIGNSNSTLISQLQSKFGNKVKHHNFDYTKICFEKLAEYLTKFDIILLPINEKSNVATDDYFSRYLCAVSANVLIVASDAPPYSDLVYNGEDGCLCVGKYEWNFALKELITNNFFYRRIMDGMKRRFSSQMAIHCFEMSIITTFSIIIDKSDDTNKLSSSFYIKKTEYPHKNRTRKEINGAQIQIAMDMIELRGLFNCDYYKKMNGDLVGLDSSCLLRHYLVYGGYEGRDPNPFFDSDWYSAKYTSEYYENINPLYHYISRGWKEGNDPHPLFSTKWYISNYLPNVEVDEIDPLSDYLRRGIANGYAPHPLFVSNEYLGSALMSPDGWSFFCQSPIISRVPPTRYLKFFQKSSSVHKGFSTLNEFINQSIANPGLINNKLSEVDLRIISAMDDLKNRLALKYRGRPQEELISVIMPTKNRATIISDSIMSVMAQSYTNFELIIIDDNGDDNLEYILDTFNDKRIRYFKLPSSRGNAGARNAGVNIARGAAIAYLDDDDQWDPDFLIISLNYMRDNDKRMVYSAQMVWSGWDETTKLGLKFGYITYAPFNRSLLENNNYISMISVLHDANFSDPIFFDETLKRFVDWDFFLRLTEYTIPISIPCILSHYFKNKDTNCVSSSVDLETGLEIVHSKMEDRAFFKKNGNFLSKWTVPDVYSLSSISMRENEHRIDNAAKQHVKIIIPNYELVHQVEMCLRSIEANTTVAYTVVISDNKSSPYTKYNIKKLQNKYKHLVVVNSDDEYGFSYAVNSGLKLIDSNDSYVAILNNDTIVTPGWLEELIFVLQADTDVGMAVPRQVLAPGNVIAREHVPCANSMFEMDINLSAHHKNVINSRWCQKYSFVELSFAPLFCALMPRRVALDVCPLDTGNGPHFRSDWILCEAIRNIYKKKIIYTPFSKVYHLQGVSTSSSGKIFT